MKTRELFIEDAPEEFYARASDDQGIVKYEKESGIGYLYFFLV